jgi:rSAM/selenodomain-associated transferase 1
MPDALIIFVRNPELGKVKTRLAQTSGQEKALNIYKQLLQHTLDITKNLAVDKYVFYTDKIPEKDMWKDAEYDRLLQKDAGLGEKMHHSFKILFEKKYRKVVIVGSDCIELTEDIILNAFHSLQDHDAVIGPANDGGYYLLGMKKLYPDFFINKKWSTEDVYERTIKDFNKLELKYFMLPVLIDVDTEQDWKLANKKNN